MRTKSFADMGCSIAGALEHVVDKWGVLILRDLGLGLSRFDEFQQSSGISPTTLTSRLRHLEEVGLIKREKYQEHPPRYRYIPTAKGWEFGVVLMALAQWGDRHDMSGLGAPPVAFFDRETGDEVSLEVISQETGKPVRNWRPGAGPGADQRSIDRLSVGEAQRQRNAGEGG